MLNKKVHILDYELTSPIALGASPILRPRKAKAGAYFNLIPHDVIALDSIRTNQSTLGHSSYPPTPLSSQRESNLDS